MTDGEAFDGPGIARALVDDAETAALATLGDDGAPFASLVTVATTARREPTLLLSDLAVHTRNLKRDARASLLFTIPNDDDTDPLTRARLTVTGTIAPDPDTASRDRFLQRHSEAAGYADFGDFAFYRLTVDRGHLVAGFGRIVEVSRADLLTSPVAT
ncbi:HugZ family protein [Bauldia sp.]|uniref:HugZ family pyridoxamine 5'-phosphate oxidase n=1 Tax=Bauldia sp. TaxID=2575872 RepID=UPI003BA97BB4